MFKKLKTEELNRITIPEFPKVKKLPIILLLDNIRSAANVGAIFRTSDAFLVEEIYLCGITPSPPHQEINKTALGATETVNWVYSKDICTVINQLKAKKHTIYALEQTTNSTFLNSSITIEKGDKNAFIFGNEVNGVSQEALDLCDTVLEIEQFGTKHSLNVSVSAGVLLWEFSKRYHSILN